MLAIVLVQFLRNAIETEGGQFFRANQDVVLLIEQESQVAPRVCQLLGDRPKIQGNNDMSARLDVLVAGPLAVVTKARQPSYSLQNEDGTRIQSLLFQLLRTL